jgi:hypothetical protein
MVATDDDLYIKFTDGPLDSPEYLRAATELWRVIGIASCVWARLEVHLDLILVFLNQPKHSEKLHDPDHPIGFKRKIRLLKRWFNQHPALAEHRDAVRSIASEMLELSQTRNAFLHSILESYDLNSQTAIFRSVRAMSPTTCQFVKHVGTIEILLNFADSSQKAHKRFVRLTTGIFTPDAIARLQKP